VDWLARSAISNMLNAGDGNDTIGARNFNVAGDDHIAIGSGAQGDVIEFGFGRWA
jgi:hypothetical protein